MGGGSRDNGRKPVSRHPDTSHAPAGGGSAGDEGPLLAAGVVHDVNQMLAVIGGRAELLLRRLPDHREELETILLAVRDASHMLERLTGHGAEEVTAAVGAEAVAAASRLVLPPDGGWRQPSRAEGAWTLDARLESDCALALPATALREVLVNLLSNALAAMPAGGRVTVRDGRDGDVGTLTVSDSGPGLPTDDPESVFAHGFTTSGHAGRGVGLAVCRQLLAFHGATLSAANADGGGAAFTIRAGLAGALAGVGGALTAGAAAVPATVPADLAVLVIDDEPAMREMLADVLGELGCRVVCHRDGTAALTAGIDPEVSVALVDRRLPGLDGVTVATRLRALAPTLAVVLMTGWDRDDVPAPDSIVDFTARKPLALVALQDLLARAGALSAARRAGRTPERGGS